MADAARNQWPESSPHLNADVLNVLGEQPSHHVILWYFGMRFAGTSVVFSNLMMRQLPCIDSLIGQKLQEIGDEQYGGPRQMPYQCKGPSKKASGTIQSCRSAVV